MNQQNRKQVIILGLMGLLLVGAVVYSITSMPGGKGATTTKKSATTVTPASMLEVDIDATEMLKIVTYRPQKYMRGRNPLQPTPMDPVGPTDGPGTINTAEVRDKIKEVKEKIVTAIIYDNVRPMAIIDDEIVELGYVYPDGVVKIHAIEPNKVIFEVDQNLVPVDMKEL